MSFCMECLFSRIGAMAMVSLGVVVFFGAITFGSPLGVSFLAGLLSCIGCWFCVLCGELGRLLWGEVEVVPIIENLEFSVVMGGVLAQRIAGVPAGAGVDADIALPTLGIA
jgi:hypothetical protein